MRGTTSTRAPAPTRLYASALAILALLVTAELASPTSATAQDTTAPASEAPPAEAAPAAEASAAQPDTATEPTAAAVAPATVRRLVVVDAATYGIDPVVGRVATDRVRETGAELGYEVADGAQTATAAQRVRMPYPPTPADLWRVTWAASAQRGAFVRVWASEGRYVVEIMVASLDGTGPFFGRETAAAAELRAVVDRLVRTTLPAASTWSESGAEPRAEAATRTPTWRERPREELAHPGGIGVRLPEPPFRRWSVSIQTEAAFGTTQGFFYNHLVGARVAVRLTRDLSLGAYVGYTNLEGRANRSDNLLFLLMGEERIHFGSRTDLALPLRVAVGYLPFNGPVIRLSAGLAYPLTEDFEIGADLVAPTFWMLPDQVAVSLDVAVEATYRFP